MVTNFVLLKCFKQIFQSLVYHVYALCFMILVSMRNTVTSNVICEKCIAVTESYILECIATS